MFKNLRLGERSLSEKEKNKIMDMCMVPMLLTYMKIGIVIMAIVYVPATVIVFSVSMQSRFYIFFAIYIICATLTLVALIEVRRPWEAIAKDTCTCFESVVLSKSVIMRGSENKRCYIITEIDNKQQKLAYHGNNFANIFWGERVFVISYKNVFGKEDFICFASKEISD